MLSSDAKDGLYILHKVCVAVGAALHPHMMHLQHPPSLPQYTLQDDCVRMQNINSGALTSCLGMHAGVCPSRACWSIYKSRPRGLIRERQSYPSFSDNTALHVSSICNA